MTKRLAALIALLALGAGCTPPKPPAPAKPPAQGGRPGKAAGVVAARSRDAAGIESKVIEIVAEQFGVDPSPQPPRAPQAPKPPRAPMHLARSTKLVADLKLDDLDRVELTMELEEEFDITIKDEDAERWVTVGDLIDTVIRAKAAPAARKPD